MRNRLLLPLLLAACSSCVAEVKRANKDPYDGERTELDPDETIDGTVDIVTELPPVPILEGVQARVRGDSAFITFVPVDDARDYRVYVLPNDSDILVSDDDVAIPNAVYRCAGDRMAPTMDVDGGPGGSATGARTFVDNQTVGGYTRSLADAQLGYVYYSAGEGRLPVYVLGDPHAKADNWAFVARFGSTRVKRYTISEEQRASLLAEGWRDDGIAFYVPAQASDLTQPIYTDLSNDGHTRYYFPSGAEKSAHPSATEAFQVLKGPSSGARVLYRVHVGKYDAFGHDELVYGKTMFERVRFQGADRQVTQLLWSGLSESTTLVVEALDVGCPYQGRIAGENIPEALDVDSAIGGDNLLDYPEARTPQEIQATATHNELFLNGQHASTNRPRAVARGFVTVSPAPTETYDWFLGFEPGTTLAPFDAMPCNGCFQKWLERSSELDVMWHTVVTGQYSLAQQFGELWVRYADWATNTNGKFRMSPTQKANVQDVTFLHVTMEVNAPSTGRRYPQIFVSDREAPIQDQLVNGNTLLMQPFGDWPSALLLQVCDHRTWDVNNQCPEFSFNTNYDADGVATSLSPAPQVGEEVAVDARTRFDFFVSTKRAYVLVNKKPMGCAELPETGIPSGEVSVTFGDVLYHSDADQLFGFYLREVKYDTFRRFDNLGFSSNVPPPAWDYDTLPCVPASQLKKVR